MPVVSICSGIFCRGAEVAQAVARDLGLEVRTDRDLAQRASELSGLEPEKLLLAMTSGGRSRTREKKLRGRAIPHLRAAMAAMLLEERPVYQGLGAHLIPKGVTHVLQVCLIAGDRFRLAQARSEGVSEEEAEELIRSEDEAARDWVEFLQGAGAWEAEHYDILSPIDKKSFEATVGLIVESARSQPLRPTKGSLAAVEGLARMARAEAALAEKGYYYPEFKVETGNRGLVVEINKQVLRLGRLEKELKKTLESEAGSGEVETKVGPGFHQSDIYRKGSFEMPGKVLLVDDERDFVETLSERLQLREVGTSVVYDGEQALAAVETEEPEVMVLDLRMPGVDGTEVLRKIKGSHPRVEVIILTGHGSPQDRENCLKLGAFAFLQKPVDFEDLSLVMRRALKKRRGG
jgi:two-component system response regulator CpxR